MKNPVTSVVAPMLAVAALAATAPLAEARSLSEADAEHAARAAVAPEPVVDVRCFRARTRNGKRERHRALCLVGRPGPSGLVCDTLVAVEYPLGGGAISTQAIRLNVCLPPRS